MTKDFRQCSDNSIYVNMNWWQLFNLIGTCVRIILSHIIICQQIMEWYAMIYIIET